MKPIRIGVDARPLSTPMSGVGRLIHETIRFFPNKNEYTFILFSHKPIHNHHKSLLLETNIHWVQGETIFSSLGGLYFTFELPKQIRSANLDIFWGGQQVLPPLLKKSLPCVLSYMDMVLYLYPETMRPIARLQQRVYQRYSVRRSNFIISISKNTNQDMMKRFGYPMERTIVVYPGIDSQRIEYLLAQEISPRIQNLPKNFILSVSTIEPRKNYRFLLEVFRSIRSSEKKLNLNWVIAGKRGWENDEFYKELNFDQNTYNDIFIREELDDGELHHLYKKSSLFWMASHYEGFGIPVLEALYHKKMAILSDIQTFKEIGGNSLNYLSTNSSQDIMKWKEMTVYCIVNNKTYDGDISKFTWENSAKEIENVFRKVLSSV